ncbi:MAG: hypothetical protein LBB47_01710 [Spirochaetaceae bacterium]|jgi:hypothetical protein|nr:hypothetical protein [Spirochaetaceae bacterium]
MGKNYGTPSILTADLFAEMTTAEINNFDRGMLPRNIAKSAKDVDLIDVEKHGDSVFSRWITR